MREIKFRAWDKTAQKIVYNIVIANTKSDNEFFVFMQYTGLKDKNGKEVYEGDILCSHAGLTLPITVNETHSYRFMWGKDLLCKADSIYGEVIGNIYEDSELIE